MLTLKLKKWIAKIYLILCTAALTWRLFKILLPFLVTPGMGKVSFLNFFLSLLVGIVFLSVGAFFYTKWSGDLEEQFPSPEKRKRKWDNVKEMCYELLSTDPTLSAEELSTAISSSYTCSEVYICAILMELLQEGKFPDYHFDEETKRLILENEALDEPGEEGENDSEACISCGEPDNGEEDSECKNLGSPLDGEPPEPSIGGKSIDGYQSEEDMDEHC